MSGGDGGRGVALVTGAGAGLGAAIARTLAAEGWVVGVLDRDADAAAEVAAPLGASGVALAADTTDEAAVEHALDRPWPERSPLPGEKVGLWSARPLTWDLVHGA